MPEPYGSLTLHYSNVNRLAGLNTENSLMNVNVAWRKQQPIVSDNGGSLFSIMLFDD